MKIVCRKVRGQFTLLVARPAGGARKELSAVERAVLERHFEGCNRCAFEYRVYSLGQAALNAAASPEAVAPDEEFFKALRARIARGPETAMAAQQQDEPWAGALLMIARQMIPAMAMLLLLIVGATLLWNNSPSRPIIQPTSADQAMRSTDRENDFAEQTSDDVLESFVAVEERWDGR